MKYLFIIGCLLLFGSCRKDGRDDSSLRVSVLRGPSAIALAGWMQDPPQIGGRQVSLEIVDSPELMQARLIKEETDIAVLPMISAANLYTKGSRYKLAGCPIWGTLYLAGRDSSGPLHVFGAGTTPDLLTRHYLQKEGTTYQLNYTFPTPGEILQGIRAGRVNAAVLSEPFLSMALEADSTFRLQADLNQPGDSAADFPGGFAQTAIVYLPRLEPCRAEIDSLLSETCRFAVGHAPEAIRTLEEKGVFAPGMLTAESIGRCKITYRTAWEAEENIRSFLEVIGRYEPKAIGGRLPDSGFISRYPLAPRKP